MTFSRSWKLDDLVVHRCFQLLELSHLPNSFHKVFIEDVISFSSNGVQPGFCANIPHVSSVESFRQLHNRLKI